MPEARWLAAARSLVDSPRGALVFLVAALLLRGIMIASQEPMSIRRTADSVEYEAVSGANVPMKLRLVSPRPPVYPAFIAFARTIGPGYRALPFLQFAVFAAAVLVLFFACRSAGFAPWESLLLTVPLTGASVLTRYVTHLIPEIVAASFGVCALAATLLIAARGPGKRRNALLAASVTGACLAKPAFLFLVPLVPVVILVIAPSFRRGGDVAPLREFVRNTAWVASPVLLYAALRFAVVGSFGIVSYAGIALAGIGTNPVFLKESDVASLPDPEMQGLARTILARRQEMAEVNTMRREFPAYVFDPAGLSAQPMLDAWSRAFDPSIFVVALPATREFYNTSRAWVLNPDWVLVNRKLGKLAAERVTSRMDLYLRWVAFSTRSGFRNVFVLEEGGRFLIALTFFGIVGGIVWRGGVKVFRDACRGNRQFVRLVLYAAVALGAVLLVNRETVFDLARNLASITQESLLQMLFPLFLVSLCVIVTLAGFFRSRTSGMIDGPAPRAVAYAALCGAYFASAMFLVGLIEMPLARYIEAVSPVLPGAVLLVMVKSAARLWWPGVRA